MNTQQLQALKNLLTRQNLNLAVAESITCGWLQTILGSLSGSSAFFAGGMTVYNLRQKVNLLGVDREHAQSVNCVSSRVAFEMAHGVSQLFQTDIGIGTTGYAEPSPENQINEPMAYFAICRRRDADIILMDEHLLYGSGLSRVAMQEFVSNTALLSLLTHLEKSKFA